MISQLKRLESAVRVGGGVFFKQSFIDELDRLDYKDEKAVKEMHFRCQNAIRLAGGEKMLEAILNDEKSIRLVGGEKMLTSIPDDYKALISQLKRLESAVRVGGGVVFKQSFIDELDRLDYKNEKAVKEMYSRCKNAIRLAGGERMLTTILNQC